jgi:hypothetical protein
MVKVISAKALLNVLPCLKLGIKCYTMYRLCSEKFGFRDTHHRCIAKYILLSNHRRPVVTRIKCEENDRLETDVRSASSCINTIDHEVLRGSSVGVVPILEPYHISFSMTFFPQPQLWHLQFGTWATCFQKGRRRHTSSITEAQP